MKYWSRWFIRRFISFQLSIIFLIKIQVTKDRNVDAQLVKRAERAGFKAIALTVDTPRLGRREADIKNRSVMFETYWNEEKEIGSDLT